MIILLLVCSFKFKRSCSNCAKNHFDFLCLSRESFNKVNSKEVPIASGSVTVNSAVLTYEKTKKSILPTFVFRVVNGGEVRCLLDIGSQCNFVSEALVCRDNLPVIGENVNIAVNGFN